MGLFKNLFSKPSDNGPMTTVTLNKIDHRSLNSYVVFDFETTGLSRDCSVIEIGAVKIQDNEVINIFSTFINPEMHIPEEATTINNITDAMVKNSPTIDTVLPLFLDFISGYPLIGYNIFSYDLPIFQRLLSKYGNGAYVFEFYDVLDLARNKLSHLPNKKLTTVANYLGISFDNAHRATDDCYTTHYCFQKLRQYSGTINKNVAVAKNSWFEYSSTTKSLQELQLIVSGIVADDMISEQEVALLDEWLNQHIYLENQFPFDRIMNIVRDVLADGIIEQNELDEMLSLFKTITDPVAASADFEKCLFCGKTFVLTGNFKHGAPEEVEQIIIDVGGAVKGSVSKKTDYVVVGALGSKQWSNGNYGNKIKRAMELQAEGSQIRIVTEDQLFDSIDK